MSDTAAGANLRGALLALAAFGIFATHDVFVKTLGEFYSPIQIVFFSVLFSFPMVLTVLLRDRTDGNLRPRHPWWTLLRTVMVVVTGFTAFYAFSVLPLAQTYAILFAAPLLITVLAVPILGETVRLRRGLAVVAGLGGVIVVLQPGAAPLGIGHAAALMAAVGGAITAIVMRKIGAEERSAVLLLYPMMGNVLVMGALLPLVYVPMPIEHLGFAALIAIFASIATYIIILAYRAAPAIIVAPMQYSQIIWATLFGAAFFGESPQSNVVLGAAIIIASGIYIVLREDRPDTSPRRPVLGSFHLGRDTGTAPRIGAMLRFLRR